MTKPTSGKGLPKAPPQPRRFSLTSRFKSGLLLAGRRPAAVVAASAEYELDPADALAVIDSFLRQVGPLDPLLRAAARFD